MSLGIPPTTTLVASPDEWVSIHSIIRENFKLYRRDYLIPVYLPFLESLIGITNELQVQYCAEECGYVKNANFKDSVENCP